ncbi:hypothetical protein SO802_004825 [Lithocarpus litseifolius]|uniref:Uncharacterized protein n=1 Tax=Lithocarpus litseifolius TaxID=425828 RepID=A0AAW2DGW9_9ROSI
MAIFLTPTHSLGHICLPKQQHVALFIFGDSLFDAGNNDYINTTTDNLSNYGPYGETFFNYPTGRFSNGHLILDFIAEFAKLPFITPLLYPSPDLTRRFIARYHLSLPALQAHGAHEVDVNRRIDDELQSRLQIAEARSS